MGQGRGEETRAREPAREGRFGTWWRGESYKEGQRGGPVFLVSEVLAPAQLLAMWGGCRERVWDARAHGPQSGRRSRSAASPRKRKKAASAPGTGPAPVCAPSGSLWVPLPGVGLALRPCWVLARKRESQHREPGGETDPQPRPGPQD